MPDRMPISVDLPAPFSPSRQCTSPRRTSNEMSLFATTPGNALVMPTSSTTGAAAEEDGRPAPASSDLGCAAALTKPVTKRRSENERSSVQRRLDLTDLAVVRDRDLARDDLGLRRLDLAPD